MRDLRHSRVLLLLPLLLLLVARHVAAQDAAADERVHALVAQLNDPKKQKQAEAELVKLGPGALGALREEARRSNGDAARRLEALVQRIERDQRQAVARGTTLMVAVAAANEPVAQLFAAFEKSTAVPIERHSVPTDAVITLTAPSVSLWDAVDQVCRTNGNLAWDVSERGIAVRGEAYAPHLLATASGYGLLFRGFAPDAREADKLRSDAVVVGPPGVVVAGHHLSYTELVDDKGTNLLKSGGGGWKLVMKSTFGDYKPLPDPDPEHPFCAAPADQLEAVPGKGATKIKSCKGVAVVHVVTELKKAADLAGAAVKKGAKAAGKATGIEITSADVGGATVHMQLAITDSRSGSKDKAMFYAESGSKIVVRDSSGGEARVTLKPTTGMMSIGGPVPTGGVETINVELDARLLPPATFAAIEIWEPAAIEEVKIPFAFKDVPITKGK